MVVTLVNDCVDVAIILASVVGISWYECRLLRDFKPASVQLCDILGSYCLASALFDIHQNELQDVTLAIGLTNKNLLRLPSPDDLGD